MSRSSKRRGAARAASEARSQRSAQRAAGERSSSGLPKANEVLKAGFTLLEVMAAVALLAVLYTVLARVAIEGLRGEGESRRRLEAALLADARIAESFTAVSGGFVLPELGRKESAEGDFTLALDVAPFVPPAEWGLDEAAGNASVLFSSAPGIPGAQALRTVQLTVSWLEGAETRQISRTIYLLDFERISALATSAQQNNPQGSPGEAGAQPPQQDLQDQQGLQDLQDLENLPSEGNQ
jgi:prepilin-type N-terminal cleavage/methylation domain-containing protein